MGDTLQPVSRIIAELARQGVTLWVEQGQLRFRGPPEAVGTATFEMLRERKREVLAFLDSYQAASALPPLRKAERPAHIPLSLTQSTLWKLEAKSPSYGQVTMQLPLPNPPQAELRERALNRLVQRHEILRTVLRNGPEGVEQVVLADCPVAFGVTDLTHVSAGKARELIDRELGPAFRAEKIDPRVGPLIRAGLFALEGDTSVMLLSVHRLFVDLASRVILAKEFAAFCQAERSKVAPNLEPLPLQFADFAIWEHANIHARDNGASSFWRARLAGIPALDLTMPGIKSRAPFDVAMKPIVVRGPVLGAIAAAASDAGLDASLVVIAAAKALIAVWADQPRIAVGFLVDLRPAGTEKLIGPFVRTQPMALDVFDTTTFGDALQQTREGFLAATHPGRVVAPEDLTAFGLDRVTLDVAKLAASSKIIETARPPTIRQHVAIMLRLTPEGISGRIDYAKGVVSNDFAAWFSDELGGFLTRACAQVRRPIADLIRSSGAQ